MGRLSKIECTYLPTYLTACIWIPSCLRNSRSFDHDRDLGLDLNTNNAIQSNVVTPRPATHSNSTIPARLQALGQLAAVDKQKLSGGGLADSRTSSACLAGTRVRQWQATNDCHHYLSLSQNSSTSN